MLNSRYRELFGALRSCMLPAPYTPYEPSLGLSVKAPETRRSAESTAPP